MPDEPLYERLLAWAQSAPMHATEQEAKAFLAGVMCAYHQRGWASSLAQERSNDQWAVDIEAARVVTEAVKA